MTMRAFGIACGVILVCVLLFVLWRTPKNEPVAGKGVVNIRPAVWFLGYFVRQMPSGKYIVVSKYSDGDVLPMIGGECSLEQATAKAEAYRKHYLERQEIERQMKRSDPNVADIPAGSLDDQRISVEPGDAPAIVNIGSGMMADPNERRATRDGAGL